MNKKVITILNKLVLVVVLGYFSGCANTSNSTQEQVPSTSQNTQDVEIVQYQEKSNTSDSQNKAKEDTQSVAQEAISDIKLDSIYFGFNKYRLSSKMQKVANLNIKNILDSKLNGEIVIEGNCDSRGSNEYNYALGLKRAKSVKNTLRKSKSIDMARVKIRLISNGESKPICKKHNRKCWAKNRRVDYRVIR